LFCQWREASSARFPDAAYPRELYDLMRAGNYRAHRLYDPFRKHVGFVPEPSDALTNMLRSLLQKEDPVGRLTTAVTGVEPPSNAVLCDLLYGGELSLVISYTHVATPDPREPVAPIAFVLWRQEGEQLVPALEAPP